MIDYRKLADSYLEKYPYQVVEFRRDCRVEYWNGTFEECKWWKNSFGTLEKLGVDLDCVAVVPTTRKGALTALGYGYELVTGIIKPEDYI